MSLTPTPALADDVILLPHAGDEALADARTAAQAAVESALAAQNLHLIDSALPEANELAACQTIDCAPALLRALDADLAIAVAVWLEGTDTAQQQVYVTLVDAAGNRFPATAAASPATSDRAPATAAASPAAAAASHTANDRSPATAAASPAASDRSPATSAVASTNVPTAARAAFLEARALQLLGPGPWIHVRGTPEGADVLIDGTRVGSLPYRARIDAGRHRLAIRHPAMLPDDRFIDIPPSPTRFVNLQVTLTRTSSSSPLPLPRTSSSSSSLPLSGGGPGRGSAGGSASPSHPLVGPVILATAGLSLGAVVLADLLADDCTRREPTGTCTKRESPNTPLAIALGATSVAAIAGAVVWYLVGEERGDDERFPGVRVYGTAVTGRF